MNRGVRYGLASAVLLLGTVVAMLFYRPAPPTKTTEPNESRRPVLGSWTAPDRCSDAHGERPVEVPVQAAPRSPQALIRASIDEAEPPPHLSRDYPQPTDMPLVELGEVPDYRLPEPPESRPAVRIHKVANGDTLLLLAEHYLGSADRAMEIFALNRDVLDAPDALRIGVELKIPPRGAARSRSRYEADRSLVPVRQ